MTNNYTYELILEKNWNFISFLYFILKKKKNISPKENFNLVIVFLYNASGSSNGSTPSPSSSANGSTGSMIIGSANGSTGSMIMGSSSSSPFWLGRTGAPS